MKKNKKQPTTNEVVEKKDFATRVSEWAKKHRQNIIWLFVILYLDFVVITFFVGFDGFKGVKEQLSYPEQQYVLLEQEMEKVIVQNEGFYPDKISNENITYDMLYHETSNSEGIYTIKMIDNTNNVYITGKIDKNFDKQTLVVERHYENNAEYKVKMLFNVLGTIFILPGLAILLLYLAWLFFVFVVTLVDVCIFLGNKLRKKK